MSACLGEAYCNFVLEVLIALKFEVFDRLGGENIWAYVLDKLALV